MALINVNQLVRVRGVRFYPLFQKLLHIELLEEFTKTGIYPHPPHPFRFLGVAL